jgi:hypothetical protein
MPSAVQTTTTPARTASGTSQAASFGSLPAAGNAVLVLAFGSNGGASTNPSCSDNQGNTYTRDEVAQNGTNGPWCAIFRCLSVGTPSGTFTVTVGGLPSGTIIEVVGVEVSGLTGAAPAASAHAHSTGNSASPSSGTATPNGAQDFAVAVFAQDGTGTDNFATPSGWTDLWKETSGTSFEFGEGVDRVLSGSANVSATWSKSASNVWAGAIACYAGAAAGGATAHLLTMLGCGG